MNLASAPLREVPILGTTRLLVRYQPEEATVWLEGARQRLLHPQPFWEAVGTQMRSSFRRDFEAGGRPRWDPLRPRTVAAKKVFLAKKPSPPFTKAGKTPRRLLQRG